MDRAAYAALDSAYNGFKTVMEEVEGAREENISKYSSSLDAGVTTSVLHVHCLRAGGGGGEIPAWLQVDCGLHLRSRHKIIDDWDPIAVGNVETLLVG
jgi:hypothetical protein